MKKILAATLLFLACAAPGARAEEYRADGDAFAVDFPAGWKKAKSDDPSVALKLERGKAFFEFSKLDSELGDYYLKARVKEQVESLRGKGISIGGDISAAGIHGVSTAYYTAYESMGASAYIGFFTYAGSSYAISARGVDGGDFRSIINTVRRPGEKIVVAKPKPRRKPQRDEEEHRVQIIKEETGIDTSSAALAALMAAGTAQAAPAEAAVPEPASSASAVAAAIEGAPSADQIMARLQTTDDKQPPFIPRRPLPFALWAGLAVLWFAGSLIAKGAASKCENPKLAPPPSDIPPDFFFPFVASRLMTASDVSYHVMTRQKQALMASYAFPHMPLLLAGLFGLAAFHAAWSTAALLGKGEAFIRFFWMLPGGRLWAALPEIVFAAPLVAGLVKLASAPKLLQVFDGQGNQVMEVSPAGDYALMRDGGGKEVARLVKKGTSMAREWAFVDTDDQVVFSIKDDHPKIFLLRKFFGSLGGALRSRYGIFAGDRRAGFVFLDPNSADRFQIHLEFNYARLAHPAQVLAAVLYVMSSERDPAYPWPF